MMLPMLNIDIGHVADLQETWFVDMCDGLTSDVGQDDGRLSQLRYVSLVIDGGSKPCYKTLSDSGAVLPVVR